MNALKHFRINASIGSLALIVALGATVEPAHATGTGPESRAQFEPASISVPVGNTCVLHPEGNTDPQQSITVKADADGVARFLAVRPTTSSSVERLALDCIDSKGDAEIYAVDLRSEEAFALRPFDPVQANLKLRPALTGDPRSYTQEELLQAGYGLRPDPAANPDGYQRWLAAVSGPAYELRTSAAPAATQPRAAGSAESSTVRVEDKKVVTVPHSGGWTGAELKGSSRKSTTVARSFSYVMNEAAFNVPTVYPGGNGTGPTSMDIWNGVSSALLFQAVVDVYATATTSNFGIHRQDFGHAGGGSPDELGVDFTPNAGDKIYAQEWYCDTKGNVNLTGGYACSLMIDETQHVQWECDRSDSPDCPSYALTASDLASQDLGDEAEFIIELETANFGPWPDFAPVTMTGSAEVVQGTGASGKGTWVTTNSDPDVRTFGGNPTSTDPLVWLDTDDITELFKRGDGHLNVTLPPGGVTWTELSTNVYYWNGSNFDDFSIACGYAIAVGPGSSSEGLTNGTPWIAGCNTGADGNRDVYKMQSGGTWKRMQSDVAVILAVSPEGHAWALNRDKQILSWNGSEFVDIAPGNCATSIGVGPNSIGLIHGTPWITGCSSAKDGNHDVYQYQADGSWKRIQDDIAVQVAVGPDGIPWAVDNAGNILYYNGSKFVFNPAGGCAWSIAVGPKSQELPNGTPWIAGCSTAADGNHDVYQLQADGWKKRQDDVGEQIAVSPAGNAWAISTLAD